MTTTDAGYEFLARWPILDDDRTLTELQVEAATQLAALTHRAQARIVGPVHWSIDPDTIELVARAPAEKRTIRHGHVARHVDEIRRMATVEHYTDLQIAVLIGGCTSSAVAKVRQRNGIPAGVGNPTLARAA